MALFDFKCNKCGETFEGFSNRGGTTQCEFCGSFETTKLISAPKTFNFKGKGFYETDYKGNK